MQEKGPETNEVLLRCLEAIRPDGLSTNEWLKRAKLNSSFLTALRNGREPGIYKVERLVAVAGQSLTTFWRTVERDRREAARSSRRKPGKRADIPPVFER